MTRKNARKTAARARQEKTGGSYQAALRAGEPKTSAPDYKSDMGTGRVPTSFTGHASRFDGKR
jgi:hypothetical protein